MAGLSGYHKLPTALAGETENNIFLMFLNEKTEEILDRLIYMFFCFSFVSILLLSAQTNLEKITLRENNLTLENNIIIFKQIPFKIFLNFSENIFTGRHSYMCLAEGVCCFDVREQKRCFLLN